MVALTSGTEMADATLKDYGYEQELKRSMGVWEVVAYGLVFLNPMAALIIYGLVAQYSRGMDSLVYVIGLVGMFFTALSYNKMIREFPIAGSVFSYIQRAINPHVGFLAGWLILIGYALIPAFIISLAGIYLSIILPVVPIWLSVGIFVAFNTIVNVRGIEWGMKANFGLLIFESGAIVAFILVGISFVAGGGGTGGMTLDPFWQAGKVDLDFVAAATAVAVVTFLGFDAMATLAEETEDSSRVIPRGIMAVLLIVGSIFVLETYVGNLVHPGFEGLSPDDGFFEIATLATGGASWLKDWLLVAFILSLGFGTALNAQLAASRILFCMSRDRTLPAFFGKIHPEFKTPYISTVSFGILTYVLAASVETETLISLVNFGAISAFIMLHAGVVWYFFIKKGEREGAKVWHYLLAPCIGAAVMLYVWSGFTMETKLLGCAWLVIGIIYGVIQSKGYKVVPSAISGI